MPGLSVDDRTLTLFALDAIATNCHILDQYQAFHSMLVKISPEQAAQIILKGGLIQEVSDEVRKFEN